MRVRMNPIGRPREEIGLGAEGDDIQAARSHAAE